MSLCPLIAPLTQVSPCLFNKVKSLENRRLAKSFPLYKISLQVKNIKIQFVHDVPKVWNELPDDIRPSTSLLSFWKKLKAYLFRKAYPTLYCILQWSLVLTSSMIFFGCVSWLLRLRVCLLMEIKC